jgi:maltose phosphorylase
MFWTERSLGTHENFGYVTAKTIPNQFEIEQFTVTAASQHIVNDALAIPDYKLNPLSVATTFVFDLASGETTALEKQTAVVTSRDVAERKQVTACAQLFTQQAQSYEDAKKQQTTAWEKRWQLADVEITGDDSAQQGIRFNLFQLFSTYYGEDERLNIGPKGFTGEKYGGATYWDTEAYAVPLYLALADPKVTKNLLKYRHKQLPQAKVNAGKQGLAGALYPMVTFTGIECHNEWEITFEEIHRNGAVAYAIYNYTNYTGDTDYLAHEGLEVLTEIARFWADRVHFSDRVGKYMIHGVTGPNEYENNVNNNWYTNTLAAWVLNYTRESYLKHQKSATVQLSEDELDTWQTIAANMYYPIDEERGIFVQHDTFLDKELRPTTTLDPAERPLNQHWSWDKILRSCFIKQADVLQGIYFFNDRYSLDEKRRNFNFYEPLTVHESSLSASVHAILACELGLTEKAVEMYARTARLDLDNYNNDTDDGLHITSMTGSWLAIVEGFAQMKTSGDALAFAPFLPDNWTSYTFHVNYRERLIKVAVTEKEVSLTLLTGSTLPLSLYGQPYQLTESLTVPLPVSEVPYV